MVHWYILTHFIVGEYVGNASIMSFCHQQWEGSTQNELKEFISPVVVEFKSGFFNQIIIWQICVSPKFCIYSSLANKAQTNLKTFHIFHTQIWKVWFWLWAWSGNRVVVFSFNWYLIIFHFREKRRKLRFRLKSGMSGEGGEDMGRVTGEKHKLIHYQQVRMRSKVGDEERMNSILSETQLGLWPFLCPHGPPLQGQVNFNAIKLKSLAFALLSCRTCILNNLSSFLQQEGFGESTWTIDLCYILYRSKYSYDDHCKILANRKKYQFLKIPTLIKFDALLLLMWDPGLTSTAQHNIQFDTNVIQSYLKWTFIKPLFPGLTWTFSTLQ